MTEAEWLVCEHPGRMLAQVVGRLSPRKLLLFGAAIGMTASLLYDAAYAGGRVVDDYVCVRAIAPNLQLVAPSGFGRIWSLVFTGGFFLSGGYRVALTEVGRTFHDRARVFLQELRALQNHARQLAMGEESDFNVVIGDLCPVREVLALLAEGASNKAIARVLGVSVHTAKFHVASLTEKLGAKGRLEAVAIAIRSGLVMV